MKKLFTLLAVVFLTSTLWAQSPEKMSYQAVIRNSSDVLVTNTQIGMEINIRQGSLSGTIVYTETQTPTTNANGLVSIEIGGGTGFSSINWASGEYYIETKTAVVPPLTSYTITGVSQLLSVPYALHAKTAETVTGGITETDPIFTAWDKSTGILITESQISDLGIYIETETDPVFNDWDKNYNDLTNKPTLFDGQYSSLTGLPTLFSGSYNDLTNQPTLFSGSFADITNKPTTIAGYGITDAFSGSYTDLTNKPTLFDGQYGSLTGSPTLFSGSYNDLTNQPTLFSGSFADLTNKPTTIAGYGITDAFSGSYTDLTNKPTLFDGQYSSLTGLPTLFSGSYNDLTNQPTLFSGSFADITNKPTTIAGYGITDAFNGTWTSLTGKPTFATVATSGSYNDLSDKPTAADGSETKVTAGTNVTVTGSGTTASPYVVNATGATTFTIGQSYQGGIIFWLDTTGQHGLIASTADQHLGIQWFNGTYRLTGTTGDGLYAGAMNTAMIIATQMADNQIGNFAAKVCADYSVTVSGVTYGDWYLPSKYELNLLYLQKTAVGGFASTYYWSSTEGNGSYAWAQAFANGNINGLEKIYTSIRVRAIRAF